MEVLIGFVIARVPLNTFSLMKGWAALSLKIKFWPWFVGGLFLPFVGLVILLRRGVKEKKVQQPLLKPVSSEEIFDQVLQLEEPRRIKRSQIQFSARA